MRNRTGGSRSEDELELEPRPGRAKRRAKRGADEPSRPLVLRVLRVIRWAATAALVLGIVGGLVIGGVLWHFGSDPKLPNIQKLGDYRPPQLTRILDRNGAPLGEIGPERRTVVSFAKIPKHFVNAVIAAEDPSFFQHQGIDYWGFLRAAVDSVLRGRIGPGRWGQGGSTITQQVVKWLLLTPEKSARRKIQEMILARRISQHLSKEEILTLYLNQINYGGAHYGCEEGARFYFGKSIADVDVGEAAFLAGVPQRPERLSPHKNPESAKNRQLYVLRQMVEHGHLDRATADRLAKEPIKVVPSAHAERSPAPEAVANVHRLLGERYGAESLTTLGATVKTTIDLRLQELAREALERGLEELDERQGYRGPLARLSGKALERHRAALVAARLSSAKPSAAATEGKGGGSQAFAASPPAAPPRPVLKPSDIVEGVVQKLDRDPANPKRGKLRIDVGGLMGVVDLEQEPRYTHGAKPLLDRFRAGDVVRVRLAPERRRPGAKDDADDDLPLALELGPQGAVVVIDPRSREILALVGGYGFRAGGFDRAQRAPRQPGSSFKPFVYASALESGRFTAASLVNDAPEVYDLWKPQNYEKEVFQGAISLRKALAHSINTVAIRLAADVGLPAIIDLATRAGVKTPIPADIGLSLALGANTVTPLELATAYTVFADGGRRGDSRLVTAIDAETLPASEPVPALRPDIAYITTSLMRSVVDEGSARTAGARLHRPLAGKTGTSSGKRDAWFVGFSPDLLAAVWVGFDDNRSLGSGEAGGRTAVPIWTEFMAKALEGRPVTDFTPPGNVTVVRIDPSTGLLAAPGSDGVEEVFSEGTAPREVAAAPGEAPSADKLLMER